LYNFSPNSFPKQTMGQNKKKPSQKPRRLFFILVNGEGMEVARYLGERALWHW
jgi:hypothetical protein